MKENYFNISMNGWYKTTLLYKVVGKQEKDGIEVFKCRDIDGNEFFIEESETITKYSRNTSTFSKTVEINLGDIIHKLQNTNSVYEVKFLTIEGDERTLKGYTIGPDENFGYTLAQDLDSKGPRRINNRGIISLILNNVKYIVK